MPGAGDVRAGGAYVELGAEDRQLNQVLRRARDKVKRFADNVGALGRRLVVAGTVAVAPLALSVRKFASYGDQIAKMARRTGFSADAVARLGHAAQISGTSIETLEVGLKRMSRTIFDASIGLAESKRTLDILSISLDEIQKKTPEQQFMMMADAIGKIKDPSKKAALAMTAMGRSGTMLIPLFNMGAKGIEKYGKEAERFGLVLGKDAFGAAEELTDAITGMRAVFKGVQLQIGQALLPLIMKWVAKITESSVAAITWIKLHKGAVITVAKLAAGLLAAGIALITVNGLMRVFIAFFSRGGAVMLAVASLSILADAFGLVNSGAAEAIGGIKIFGRSTHDWTTFASFSWLKLYEKIKFIAVGMAGLWRPIIERMKGAWRGMSVFLADSFLWAVEKVLKALSKMAGAATVARARLRFGLGLITKTEYDITVSMAEDSMFPGTRRWIAETRAGLDEYSKELERKSREGIDAADDAWDESFKKREAKMKKEVDALNKTQRKFFGENERRDKVRDAERKRRADEQAERIGALQKQLDALGAGEGAGEIGIGKPGVAAQAVTGTTRGWRALGVAAGFTSEMVTRLRNIDKSTAATAIFIRDVTGRYGGS